jgi:hypothetical protein
LSGKLVAVKRSSLSKRNLTMTRHYRSAQSYRNAYNSRPHNIIEPAPSRFDAPTYSTGVFLAAVAEVIRTNGFFKELCASQAFELVVANKDERHEFTVEDWTTAAQAIAWLSEKDVKPGFESDLLNAVSAVELPQNKMRLAMYAIKMFVEHAAKVAAAPAGNSAHIGSIKERLTLTVHVFESTVTYSEWGTSYRTKAATAEGNVVMWFAKEEVALGDYSITGTVTKHNEYEGVKETYLNRVKVGA